MKVVINDQQKLYKKPRLESFLTNHMEVPTSNNYPREALVGILSEYNQLIGNDKEALANIEKLKQKDRFCVFTGQQVGLMGGPTYTILKAISCLLLAREKGAIPIFWLASEDHDVGEIDHTYLLDSVGNLKKYHLSLPKDGRFVEDLNVLPQHHGVLQGFLRDVNQEMLIPTIKNEESYMLLMVRFLVHLFSGTGLVFVEPKLLRPHATDFLRKEIKCHKEIADVLVETTERLKKEGGQPQIQVGSGTNLFLKDEKGMRHKIQVEGGAFCVGTESYTMTKLLTLLDKSPERFSTNVAARPVLQSYLFPTAAYVAGPGELNYYLQLKDYHSYHGVMMPWIVPRLSVTMLTPFAQEMLEKCHLDPKSVIPHHWEEVFPKLAEEFDDLEKSWIESAIHSLQGDMTPEAITRYIRHTTGKLKRKICTARLRKKGIPSHSLHYLHNLIHPHQKLQERVLNWWGFQAETELNLVQEMMQHLKWNTSFHAYVYL